ncbi:MAG: aromatic ring-hydroxylating dioxygenase subunit alpha [Dehalococcoidia bacterium]|nr:aromatic ring-hydroxylating dioxygenase subunit alpha [Dehalococcoidia bacterium]
MADGRAKDIPVNLRMKAMRTKLSGLVDAEKGLLDRSIFVDKDLYQQELEQIFGRCWLVIGHESQVPNPNDFASSYMGEDPVLLTRDSKGKLHAFLNMCRHRGNRICRADAGNAPSFMCTYHGWTFATDGKLVGVPGYKEAYFEELDRSQWGLVEARVDSYKGLVFATWDKQAPSLPDYLSDIPWYMDLQFDRRAGGTEVVGGILKWILPANWKFPADNFAGDNYHAPITHASTNLAGIRHGRNPTPGSGGRGQSYSVHAGNGHGVISIGINPNREELRNAPPSLNVPDIVRDYYDAHMKEFNQRLGSLRASNITPKILTVFPNFSTHMRSQLRVYHPRGPERTEMWVYCLVDKETPHEVREAMHTNLTLTFGPSGTLDQDDMNNWVQCTASGKGLMGKKHLINLQLGLGHDGHNELVPGTVGTNPSETPQRYYYARWAELMDASSWSDISSSPITYTTK